MSKKKCQESLCAFGGEISLDLFFLRNDLSCVTCKLFFEIALSMEKPHFCVWKQYDKTSFLDPEGHDVQSRSTLQKVENRCQDRDCKAAVLCTFSNLLSLSTYTLFLLNITDVN